MKQISFQILSKGKTSLRLILSSLLLLTALQPAVQALPLCSSFATASPSGDSCTTSTALDLSGCSSPWDQDVPIFCPGDVTGPCLPNGLGYSQTHSSVEIRHLAGRTASGCLLGGICQYSWGTITDGACGPICVTSCVPSSSSSSSGGGSSGSSSSSSSGGPGTCVTSTAFSSVARAFRRGEGMPMVSDNASQACMASNNTWGPVYSDNKSNTNNVVWKDFSNLGLHNASTITNPTLAIGAPATLNNANEVFIQVGDPVSVSTAALTIHGPAGNDSRHTSVLRVPGIFSAAAASGVSADAPTTWPITVVAGQNLTKLSMTLANYPIGTSFTPLPDMGAMSCPCTSGTPCDTNHSTLPDPAIPVNPAVDASDVSYGPSPDSHTPYVVVGNSHSWGIVTGKVTDAGGTALSGITVGAQPAVPGAFTPIEKITDSDGNYLLLIDGDGDIVLTANDTKILTGTPDTHYFNPHYQTSAPLSVANTLWNMAGPLGVQAGSTNLKANKNFALPLRTAVASTSGTSAISGRVITTETGNGIGNLTVNLLDSEGGIQQLATTAPDGSFVYGTVKNGYSYTVSPVVDSSWILAPGSITIPNLTAAVAGVNFAVKGVPTNAVILTHQPGSMVLVTPGADPGGTATDMPPILINKGTTQLVGYSSTSDGTNKAMLSIPAASYWLRCWDRQSDGSYVRGKTSFTTGNPGTTLNVACP